MGSINAKKYFGFILIGIIFFNSPLFSQGIGMPPKILAMLTQKVMAYVQDFPSKKVTIVYPAGQEKTRDGLIKEFGAIGFNADAVEETKSGAISGDIIILIPGLNDGSIKSLPFQKKVYLSASKEHTDKGLSSFAIVNIDGKPKIMVNLEHIEKTGIKVSGKLYRVAQKSS